MELATQITQENRPATQEEQALLVKYVGFGAGEIRNKLFPPATAEESAQYPNANQQIIPEITANHLPASMSAAEKSRWVDLATRLSTLLSPEDQKTLLRSTPVSYTHLDVYKRQVKDWTPADVESAFARTMTWIVKHKTQNAPTAAATESASQPQPEGMPDEKGKAEAEALLKNQQTPPASTEVGSHWNLDRIEAELAMPEGTAKGVFFQGSNEYQTAKLSAKDAARIDQTARNLGWQVTGKTEYSDGTVSVSVRPPKQTETPTNVASPQENAPKVALPHVLDSDGNGSNDGVLETGTPEPVAADRTKTTVRTESFPDLAARYEVVEADDLNPSHTFSGNHAVSNPNYDQERQPRPVSYTHLDVYKRQPSLSPPSLCPAAR